MFVICVALMCCCSSILFSCQVVVDSDQTAKALLERGQLTKRVTIIPLNQVGVRWSPRGDGGDYAQGQWS